MAGGYPRPTGDDLWQQLAGFFAEVKRQLRELQTSTGTQITDLVAQVKAKLAELDATVNALVAAALGNYYTIAQTDSRILNPGNIFPGHVSASGTVSGNVGGNFPGGLISTGAYGTNVTGGGAYVAAWIHNDGRVGFAPSSRRFKTDFKPARFTIEEVLKLEGFFFQYLASVPYDQAQQRVMLGLLAEDTHKAGFHWLVDYDADGKPFGIRPDILSAVVLEGMRDLYGRVVALENKL